MDNTSLQGKKTAIRQGKPIPECGLIFYPILMENYEIFCVCKQALELRLATLPVKFAVMDFLSGVFAFDYDRIKTDGKASGLFSKIMTVLYLALRIRIDDKDFDGNIYYELDGDIARLQKLVINQTGEAVEITPYDFSTKILPLLAEMNGIARPDESENLDLVRSYEELKELSADNKKVRYSIDSLISSVAYLSRVSEKEIDLWAVREFEARQRAIERDKRYTLYAQAELGGMVTFKKGNPYPSWCFDTEDESLGTRSLGEVGKQIGVKK